ncbi:hypothetical protein [Salaquimonas pukyongi]|uniref:hypothetical protein n=1 Tax=Salaquimonas pukyongi TaxID=2712698 RepID=UPI0012EB7C39|nr:hypothetical protein [Salaquimonas pukyongi]
MTKVFQKARARDEILDFVLQNCLAHRLGDERPSGYGPAFNPIGFLGKMAQAGDLILVSGIPQHGWSLCWLHRISSDQPENRYLCESVETGEMSWWSNVGIEYLDRDVVESHPQWRWTDQQFAFNDRWQRACGEPADWRGLKPLMPVFEAGFSVALALQAATGWREERQERRFEDYRKVTKTEMRSFFMHCLSETVKA